MYDSHDTPGDSYQVVARRYRPQTFEELIGQEHVARALQQAITTRRIGHAYLFTGARGVGKTSAARVLAKALNCIQGPTPTPCNECEVCRSITSGDDMDVIEIDGASNRQIDDIRQLRQNVAIRPSRVPYKIYIIDEVHMLTKEAFNALLKTLEEPPEHVKFIFATTDPQKLPITILSRCQRYDFAGIEKTSIETRLGQIAEAEGVTVEPDVLSLLASRAAGSMRDSQSLLEQLLAVAGEKITLDEVYQLLGIAPAERLTRLVQAIADRQGKVALTELHEAIAGGAEEGQLVEQLLGYFRDILAASVGCDPSAMLYLLPSQQPHALELGQQLGVSTILAMTQILDHASDRMRVSLHTRILVEMAVVRMCHLPDLDDLATNLRELKSLPATAESATPGLKKNDSPSPLAAGHPPEPPLRLAESHLSPPPRAAMAPATREEAPQPAAAPTPAALPPATPDSLDTPRVAAAWQRALESIEGLAATQAELASGIEWTPEGVVVVRFSATDAPSRDYCDSPNSRALLERALNSELGQTVTLRFEVDKQAAPGPTPTAAPPPPPRASRRQMQQEVAEHPFVSRAMELFAVDANKLRVVDAAAPRPGNRGSRE